MLRPGPLKSPAGVFLDDYVSTRTKLLKLYHQTLYGVLMVSPASSPRRPQACRPTAGHAAAHPARQLQRCNYAATYCARQTPPNGRRARLPLNPGARTGATRCAGACAVRVLVKRRYMVLLLGRVVEKSFINSEGMYFAMVAL